MQPLRKKTQAGYGQGLYTHYCIWTWSSPLTFIVFVRKAPIPLHPGALRTGLHAKSVVIVCIYTTTMVGDILFPWYLIANALTYQVASSQLPESLSIVLRFDICPQINTVEKITEFLNEHKLIQSEGLLPLVKRRFLVCWGLERGIRWNESWHKGICQGLRVHQ